MDDTEFRPLKEYRMNLIAAQQRDPENDIPKKQTRSKMKRLLSVCLCVCLSFCFLLLFIVSKLLLVQHVSSLLKMHEVEVDGSKPVMLNQRKRNRTTSSREYKVTIFYCIVYLLV